MPIPPGFDNRVRVLSSVDTATLNAELTTQNTAGYWFTNMMIDSSGSAVLLFSKSDFGILGFNGQQKMNQLSIDQEDIDHDAAAEVEDGYYPTGIFVDPTQPTQVFVAYSLLSSGALP